MRSILIFLLSCCCLLFATDLTPPDLAIPTQPYDITILHFNDYHGKMLPVSVDGEDMGGVARLAGLVEMIRHDNQLRGKATILLIAGDTMGGSYLSNLNSGDADVETINLMKPDAVVLGNHEFDFGFDKLNQHMEDSTFPWISANTRRGDGSQVTEPYTIIKRKVGDREVLIAVFGLTTTEAASNGRGDPAKVLVVDPPLGTARNMIAQLKTAGFGNSRPDLIIALNHLTYDEDLDMAYSLPELDVIIGGHSHLAYLWDVPHHSSNGMSETYAVSAEARGCYLGRMDYRLEPGKRAQMVSWTLLPVSTIYPEFAPVKTKVDSYIKDAKIDNSVIGNSKKTIGGNTRTGESEMGNLVCDAVKKATGADVVLQNGGTIRGSLPQGKISFLDVMEALPYPNKLIMVEMSGADLKRTVEYGVSKSGSGGFPQWSGMKMTVSQGKVQDALVKGKPMDDAGIYKVCVNEYMANGGDGYEILAKLTDKKDTGKLLSQTVLDFIKAQKELDVNLDGRMELK